MRNWLNSIKRLLGGNTKRPLPLRTREQLRRAKLGVEMLETRITPSTLSYDSGNHKLIYTSDPSNDTLTVSVSGSTYTFTDPAQSITLGDSNFPAPPNWSTSGNGTPSSPSIATGPLQASDSIQITGHDSGTDVFNIRSISNPTTLSDSAATINVASNAPMNTGNLAGINAPLTVNAAAGAGDTLVLSNFSATTGDSNVVFSGNTITGFAPQPITLTTSPAIPPVLPAGSFSLVRLIGSNNVALNEVFTLNSPSAPVQVDGDAGPDTINVEALSHAATVNGGAGNDTINVSSDGSGLTGNLHGIAGLLTVDGGTGTNALNVSDFSDTSGGIFNLSGTTSVAVLNSATFGTGGSIMARATGGTQVDTIQGSNTGNDTFTVTAATGFSGQTVNLLGGGGNDSFAVNGPLVGSIDGGAGTDTLSVAGNATLTGSATNGYAGTNANISGGFSNIDTLTDSGPGPDTLTGESVASTWALGATSTYNDGSAGSLTFSGYKTLQGGTAADTFNVTAAVTQNLAGGAGNDTFTFTGSGATTGTVDGQGGTDALNVAGNATLTGSTANGYGGTNASTGGFAGIDTLTDNGSGSDTLTGENVASTWALGASTTYNDGSAASLTFAGYKTLQGGTAADTFNVTAAVTQNLAGGDGADTFTFTGSGKTTGTVDGQAGTDALNVGGNATLTGSGTNGVAGTNASTGGFAGIDTLTDNGSGSDTLTGRDVASTWALGGTTTYSDGTATLTFTGYKTLQGGSAADTFNVTAAVTQNLAGGAGNDTFSFTGSGATSGTVDGGAGTDTLNVAGNVTLTGSANTATETGYAGTNASITGNFSGIDTLTDNGSGSDTLTGEGTASTWLIDGPSTYNDGSGVSLTFSGYKTMTGGAGNDTFTIQTPGDGTGTLDGGGGTNTLNAANINTTTLIADGYHYLNFQVLNQGVVIGPNADTTWEWNGTFWTENGTNIGTPGTIQGGSAKDTFIIDAGTTTSTNLFGNDGDDSFTLRSGATVTGILDGGSGNNALNVAGSVTLTGSSNTATEVGYTGTNANVTAGFSGISVLTDNGAGSDTLTGEGVASTWALGATETYNDGRGNGSLTFSGYSTLQAGNGGDSFSVTAPTTEALKGGTGNDTFSVASGQTLTGSIDGGAGTDKLNLSGGVTLTGSAANGYAGSNASVTGGFSNIDTLNGSGSDTLTGEGVASTWALGATETYNDGTGHGSLTFAGYATLQAGNGGDSFSVTAPTTAALKGGTGNDTFTVASGQTLTGSIDGGAGTDALNVAGNATLTGSATNGYAGTNASVTGGFAGIDSLTDNGSGSDTLTGEGVASTWTIGATDTYNDGTATLTFASYANLQGGSAADTFKFASGGSVSGNVNGGGASSGSDTLDYSALAGPVSVNLANSTATGIGGTFSNITNFVGSAGSDTLTGANTANTWNVTASNAGNVNGTVTFSSFENLTGGTAADTFKFADNIGVSGTVNGGGGTDTLDYSAYTSAHAVTVNLQTSAATNLGGFTSITNFVGGAGSDTLTGANTANTWNLTGANTGNINSTVTYSSFENLAGGTAADTFAFTASGSVTGNIDGGGASSGSDTIDYSALTTQVKVTISDASATGWTSATGGATGIGGLFRGITTVKGGSGTTDVLTGETNVPSLWTLDTSFTYTAGAGSTAGPLVFSGFETLQGGGSATNTFNVNVNAAEILIGGSGNDTFTVASGKTLTGSIDGGAGADTLNVGGNATLTGSGTNGYAGTNASVTAGFAGIDVLNGSGTLTGENTASTWTVDTSDTYNDGTAVTLTFSGYGTLQGGNAADTFKVNVSATENLLGGSGNDTFTVASGKTLTGNIDGQDGTDALNVAGSVTLTGSANLTNETGYAGTNANITAGFSGIDTLTDNGSGTDTLTGENTDAIWTLGGGFTYKESASAAVTLAFSGYKSLQGGTGKDSFSVTTANATQNLLGGGGDDTFSFTGTGRTTGAVDGGTGSDTLNTAGSVTLTGSANTATETGYAGTNANMSGNFVGIDTLNSSGTLTGENTASNVNSTWNLGTSYTYNDGSAVTLTFSGFGTLQGGTGPDIFNVTKTTAGVPLTINGDGGGNTYNVGSVGGGGTGTLDGIAGDFTINGGGANDTLTVDDGGKAAAESYTVTATDVQRLGTGLISYNAIGALNVDTASAGGSSLDVESTPAGVLTTVNVAGGSNDLEIAQVGQTIGSVGNVTFAGTGSSDSLTVNDQGTRTAQTYTIHPDANTGVFTTSGATINLVNTVGNIIVYGGSGGDTFHDSASKNTTVWVTGGDGANSNSLSGDSAPTVGNFHDDGQGTITGPAGYKPIYYFNIGHVDVSGF
jgi:acrosin